MSRDPIAIIGAAARLPGAATLDAYWDLLISGRDAVTEVPDGRWSKAYYYHPRGAEFGKSYTWAAGVVDNLDRFDAAFFGISPREAEQLDPHQRLVLELAWEALEDAGVPAGRIAGSAAGVYVGVAAGDYANARMGDPAAGDAYFMTGATASIVANRLSYVFDLHGPSFVVDTACSSSLVALDLAVKAIEEGRVPMAIVAGVNLLLSPFPYIGFCRASMLSPSGRCFAFDARANGYVRGEGGGVVVLKPLSQALADGDRVRGLIAGTGVNADGRTVGLSMPNRRAQAALLRSVYDEAGVAPEALAFMEAHGTGTPVGDPIELAAIGEALARRRDAPLLVGSAKTNIGHLETASGMAGILKAMLALEHRVLPPSGNFEAPNPHIDFETLNLEVATRPTPLHGDPAKLLAGVNSFGFGGANAHAILAAAPTPAPRSISAAAALPPLLISARSEAALAELAQAWSQRLETVATPAAPALVRAAAHRRDHHRHRLVAWGETPAAIAQALQAQGASAPGAGLVQGSATSGEVAFVYSGNGSQWLGMGRDALRHSPAFREAVERVDALLEPRLGWSVIERLTTDEPAAEQARTDVAQPLLFALQVGVTEALRAAGVTPTAYVGHSVGEIAAAWAAGALSLEAAAQVVVARSEEQQRTQGAGRMAALGLNAGATAEVLDRLGGGLEIAAVNSANAVTVAGSARDLDRLRSEAERQGWRYTPLDLDYAFHHAVLEPIRDNLLRKLADLETQPCGAAFYSTVEGGPLGEARLDARYWWRNIREPVRFAQAMDRLAADGRRILVEIGPHPVLQSYMREAVRSAEPEGRVLSTLNREPRDGDPFQTIAAQIHAAGGDISTAAVFDGPAEIDGLPPYPWNREHHWVAKTAEAMLVSSPLQDHPLLGFRWEGQGSRWSGLLDLALQPWLADHALEQMALLPAAAMIELALAAAHTLSPEPEALEIGDLEIVRALPLEPNKARELRVRLDDDRRVLIESRARLSDEGWAVHAVARVAAGQAAPAAGPRPFEARRVVSAAEVYGLAASMGLNYGPRFQVVSHVEIGEGDDALVHFNAGSIGSAEPGMLLSPTLLDGALQGFLALAVGKGSAADGASFLPSRFGSVRLAAPFHRAPASARISVQRRGTRSFQGGIVLFDAEGGVVAELGDCWFRRVQLNREAPSERAFHFERLAAPRAEDDVSHPVDLDAVLAAAAGETAPAGDLGLLFDAFVAASTYAAVRQAAPDEAAFNVPALIGAGVLAVDAAPLFSAGLQLLERHGLATDAADGWRLSATNDLGDAASIWRTVLEEEPGLGADLALAAAAAEALPRVFREGLAVAASPSAALLEQVLYDSPAGRRATEALLAGVASVAAQWPRGRRLRVLEIGAGGGVFSRRLLRQLKAWPGRATYVAADPDPDAVGRLSLLLGAHARAACWDPQAGGAPPGRFDVIVSAYGLTRLGLDEDGLGALRGALADGGVLLTAEPAPNAAWDVLFGGDERWWRASLTPEFPRRPIEDAEGWRAKLARAAFMAQPAVLLATAPWDATVLAARRIGAEAERTEPRRAGAVVIANSGGGLATRLAARLSGKDLPVHVLDMEGAEASPFAEALAAADGAVLELLALPAADPARPADAGARLAGVLQAARAATEAGGRVRLWIVTGGAQQDQADPVEAAVWGLGRTLANESSELDVRLVDLPGLAGSAAANRLAAEILSPDAETEIVWTHEGRHVLRLERGLPDVPQPAGPVELDAAQPGLLDSLAWKAAPHREPGEGEVAIEVRAAGLNFRDVMWALGLLPEEALIDGFAGATFGLECAGVISAVGPGVGDLAVGQRVAAFAPASLASRAVTAAHAVAPIPDSLSFAAAATIPVAYLTVVYALGRLAELELGETVLIHGGAGGVGLAAIQYAKHRGAVVIATAGSEVKRAFLRQCGADHVFDSRSLAFVDAVRGATCGEGVDVVLNSLNGEAMERSLGLLKPFGRFLELGKRDFYMDTRVGLRPLRQNVSYFAIDADRLPLHRPALAKALLAEAMALIGSGALRPLPHRTLPFAEASHAFRLMQAAGHIGKLVLTPEPPPTAAAQAPRAFPVRADATYLVSGGLAGFGLETAKWLVDRGARHLALLGRRGADTPGATQALAMLEEAGVEARAFACDVSDEAGVAATLAEIRRTMPPLRGVVHAAMVVDDGLLSDLTRERIETVLAPKLTGALNLDRLTADDPIELFLLYSSATTVLGAPGQGSYVAANMALEALARRRAARGLPALSIAWGPIADVGLLARQEAARDELARRLSATPMAAREALDALPALWGSRLPVAAYAAVQWDAVQRRLPIFASPTFAGLAKAAAGDLGEADLAERLASLSPDEAQTFVTGLLTEEIARILSSSPDRIDAHRPLSELGMDSLMALELRMTLENRLGVSLPLLTLSDTTTLAGIAARVVTGLSGAQAEAEPIAEAIARHELADPRDAGVETAPMDMPMSTAAE